MLRGTNNPLMMSVDILNVIMLSVMAPRVGIDKTTSKLPAIFIKNGRESAVNKALDDSTYSG